MRYFWVIESPHQAITWTIVMVPWEGKIADRRTKYFVSLVCLKFLENKGSFKITHTPKYLESQTRYQKEINYLFLKVS